MRDPARYRLVGTSPPRLDIPDKVRGRTRFCADERHPGMLFGTIRHAPGVGARIAAVDTAPLGDLAARVRVVPVTERAVAVLADDTWTAMRAARRLAIQPTRLEMPDSAAILAGFEASFDDPDAPVFEARGDAETLWREADQRLEATYRLPYLAHLCMEPMSCSALYADGRLTLWAPTQAHSLARDVAARQLGLDRDAVSVHTTWIGGGFGRRAEMDFIEQAAAAARAVPGRPVHLCWSREEDIRNDMYRQAAAGRVRGALDDAGRITTLDYVLASQSVVASYHARTPNPRGGNARRDRSALAGALDLYYAIPATRCRYVPHELDVPVGFWRAVGNSVNPFLIESFIDELAALAGADPVAFRSAHLDDRPKHRRVLEAAAERAGWGGALPARHGRGVALIESHGSIVAQVVEVGVANDGAVRVQRVTCVVDCRVAVHPDSVVAQMEGGILQGLNAALYGEITVRNGQIEQRNFDDCRMLRLADTPEIEVVLLPQGGRPGGAGEPGLPGVAPALANAIFAATGVRLRSLPIGRVAAAA